MSKYYAYIRVSTDKQTLENQKHKILEFAFNKKIQIEDFIEVEVSSRKNQKERLIEYLFFTYSCCFVLRKDFSVFFKW